VRSASLLGAAPYAQFLPMKVLMLTLQNDPPTIEIYPDQSYKFSSAFSDMLKLALVKDPKKRKPATEILKHNFFKQAKEIDYIKASFVKNIPRSDPTKVLTSFRVEKEAKEAPVDDDVFVFDAADLKAATAKIQKGEAVDLQPLRQPPKPEQKGPPPPPPSAAAAAAATAAAATNTAAAGPPPPDMRQRGLSTGSRFTVDGDHAPPPPKNAISPPRPLEGQPSASRFTVVEK